MDLQAATRLSGRPARRGALALGAAACLALVATESAAAATPACATTITVTTGPSGITTPSSPAPGAPCWTDVTPYPFGSDGLPVDPTTELCKPEPRVNDQLSCYLTVTSMAFRAWNRGLAATAPAGQSNNNPFAVWKFNGSRWFPDPTFPGSGSCPGHTIVWAGKLDYWLVGGPTLCRFDGVNFLWEPLAAPRATVNRLTVLTHPTPPATVVPQISAAACYSWDNCWFFGPYSTVLHWDGALLTDVSPDPAQASLLTGFSGAIARLDAGGSPFGVAVGATSAVRSSGAPPLPAAPDGTPPAQLFASTGGPFAPAPYTPPTQPLPSDPFRTDLVAVDLGADRQGWVAGNPAGLQAAPIGALINPAARPLGRGAPQAQAQQLAPLLTTTAAGAPSTCVGPPADRFTFAAQSTPSAPVDAFLWSTVSIFPGEGNALAGGQLWPATTGPGPDEDGSPEPVIVAAGCDGTTTTTRFTIPDPINGGAAKPELAPADRDGTITAIAANASNDAWASASAGGIDLHDPTPGNPNTVFVERPHLYRLTDGQPPAAPAGDDAETRPLQLQFDPPPPPPQLPPPVPAPQPPPVVAQTPTRDPPASIYGVRSKIVGRGRLEVLYLLFKLRRPVTVGAEALRYGRIVSRAALRRFKGRTGQLALRIDQGHYPTAVRFVTNAPAVTLKDPGNRLSGTVQLVARPRAHHGRRIASVSFEYSQAGMGLWTTIATPTAPPWTGAFMTTLLAPGRYDLRAVATDNKGDSGVSAPAAKRLIPAQGHA